MAILLDTPPPAPVAPALPMLSDELQIVDDDITVDLDFQSLDDTDVPVDIQEYVRQDVVEEEVEDDPIPFVTVEQKPTFNGGDANGFAKWVNSRLVYPEVAKENGVEGRVTLQFTIGKDRPRRQGLLHFPGHLSAALVNDRISVVNSRF